MEKTFSQRMGLTPIRNVLQINSMDEALRNSLWNYCYERFFSSHYYDCEIDKRWVLLVCTDFFKKISRNCNIYELVDLYEKYFIEAKWYKVYDLLEFLACHEDATPYDLMKQYPSPQEQYIRGVNDILQREMSGYRFIGTKLTPITSEVEIESIEEAQQNNAASIHINAAITLLSDRLNPNYRNSIKESISAVEAVCRKGTDASTLGQALNELEIRKGFKLNPQFKKGLEKIYAYTNNKDTGIRHALLDSTEDICFEDAKFMLVLCSAFVNYFSDKLK